MERQRLRDRRMIVRYQSLNPIRRNKGISKRNREIPKSKSVIRARQRNKSKKANKMGNRTGNKMGNKDKMELKDRRNLSCKSRRR